MRSSDNAQRFLIESCDVRGQLVQLDNTWREAVARVDYPARVKVVLGEAFVAAVLLAGTIKFEGRMTLQIRGQGYVRLLVVQVSADRQVRGLARWNREDDGRLAAATSENPGSVDATKSIADIDDGSDPALAGGQPERPRASQSLIDLFGADARLVITIEARKDAPPYQGIVALHGDSLADALANYFRNSEQLPTALYLSVDDTTAAGMLLQKIPASEQRNEDDDGWPRATMLADTLSGDELRRLPVAELLHALFHEEQVRLFDEQEVGFVCNCSRERTSAMLEGLGEAEVQSIIDERGSVEITCEFCDAEYRYDAVDVAALFHGTADAASEQRH